MQENLLSDLNYASRLIHKTADLMQKIENIKKEYMERKALFKERPRYAIKMWAIVLVLGFVFHMIHISSPMETLTGLLPDNLWAIVFGIGFFGYVIFSTYQVYIKKNTTQYQKGAIVGSLKFFAKWFWSLLKDTQNFFVFVISGTILFIILLIPVFIIIYASDNHSWNILVVGIATGYIGFLIVRKLFDAYYNKKNKEIDQYNDNVQKKMEPYALQLIDVQNEYLDNCSSWYPNSYCCVAAVDSFIRNIENYRADTLKEAVNLYEEELHRWRMERSQKQILKNQQSMLDQQEAMLEHQNYANVLAEESLRQQVDTNDRLKKIYKAVAPRPTFVDMMMHPTNPDYF